LNFKIYQFEKKLFAKKLQEELQIGEWQIYEKNIFHQFEQLFEQLIQMKQVI
jgi:hypothetical protein